MIKKKFNDDLSIEQNIKICSDITQSKISELLDYNKENIIVDAMRYMLLSNGKMIRPFLVFATNSIFSKNIPNYIVDLAAAIEMIHTYTLIHDDLPAMDNDDFRRGQLSCHKKFQESTAILTGDSLLTFAFELISNLDNNLNPKLQLIIINELSKLIGYKGLILGQILDLNMKKDTYDEISLERLRKLKTANLFIASCKCSAILNNANEKEIEILCSFAEKLGLAYQIKDDIDDNEKFKGNNSLIDIINEALKCLDFFDTKALLLRNFTEYLFMSYIK